MTPEVETLARRAVACPRWRWLPGMRYRVGSIVGRLTDNQCKGKLQLVPDALPDLNDPATRGCVLELVREALRKPSIYLAPFYTNTDAGQVAWWGLANNVDWDPQPRIQYLTTSQGIIDYYLAAETEAAALVAALEAAP
jgi:hypothetical protein